MTAFVVVETAASWLRVGKLRVMMVYTRNDVIQEIPFVLQVNADAFLANVDRADFLTMIVLAKLENVFAINCSDIVTFTQVSTKRKVTTSAHFTFK